jgi:hypothetical protein
LTDKTTRERSIEKSGAIAMLLMMMKVVTTLFRKEKEGEEGEGKGRRANDACFQNAD